MERARLARETDVSSENAAAAESAKPFYARERSEREEEEKGGRQAGKQAGDIACARS